MYFSLLLGSRRDICFEVVKLQRLKYIEYDIHDLQELVLDLVGGAEDVGIVLRETAYTCQSVKLAALFVAVYCAKFRQTQWQFAV